MTSVVKQQEGTTQFNRDCHYCSLVITYTAEGQQGTPQLRVISASPTHICKLAEETRQHYAELLANIGSYEVERKIKKMQSYRLYDRKYPYDVATKAMDIEFAYNLSSDSPDPLGAIIDQENFDEQLSKLTDTQQEHAKLYMAGYKPRDIAAMEGRETSNAVRWQRHNSKERLEN